MDAKRAISILKNRLTAYAQRQNANVEYLTTTADVINALVDLYNRVELAEKREIEIKEYLKFAGVNPEILDVPVEVIRMHTKKLYLNWYVKMFEPEDCKRLAYDNRVEMAIYRYKYDIISDMHTQRIVEDLAKSFLDKCNVDAYHRIQNIASYPLFLSDKDLLDYMLNEPCNYAD